jgi:signal transduction histidine kinase/ActR/RegA family two-component response regulator
MWGAVLGRQSWQGELTNRRKDGQLRHTSLTISPIVDSQGRLTHFVGIHRDITEHKRLEQQMLQMQKMQSVGTLAGGIAHEFNNLMAGINGYAALGLREEEVSETLRQFLHNIVDLSERCATLTRQLLAFARKPALVRQPTFLAELLRSTAELVGRTLHQEVELDLPAEVSVPLLVEADSNQLQQALVNLALNARDALASKHGDENASRAEGEPPGYPRAEKVVFQLRHVVLTADKPAFPQTVPAGDYFLVQVKDTGTGMPPEVLAQSLDPFFTTKEVGQGTGLGLPMVYGIVQGHQGHLVIETAVGQGTSVGLYLPRLVGPPAGSPRRPDVLPVLMDEVVEPEQVPGHSILVIDDEEPVLDVVRRFLEIAGHRVRCATGGAKALAQLTSGPPVDLIILDVMMPREDTQATFQRLREATPGVPVLLCTGLADASPAPWLLRQPNTALLRKPFRMNELWYSVRQMLAERGPEA